MQLPLRRPNCISYSMVATADILKEAERKLVDRQRSSFHIKCRNFYLFAPLMIAIRPCHNSVSFNSLPTKTVLLSITYLDWEREIHLKARNNNAAFRICAGPDSAQEPPLLPSKGFTPGHPLRLSHNRKPESQRGLLNSLRSRFKALTTLSET